MTYGDMVGQLKSTIEEEGHTASAMVTLELLQHLQSIAKKDDPVLDNLAKSLGDHLIAMQQEKWSVAKYFSGFGPIACKLRDYAAITKHYSLGNYKLEEHLKKFDFKPVTDDGEQAKEFRKWLEEVGNNAFGSYHDIQLPLPYVAGIEVGLPTGIHTTAPESYAADAEIPRYLVLAVDLKSGLKARYIVRRDHRAILLYWHPHEEVWLADGAGVLFEGVWEGFKVEWEKLAQKSGYTAEAPVDVEANLKQLEEKSNFIFDNEEKLPDSCRFYNRNDDGMSSYMSLTIETYVLNFMNTKGQWASRNMRLSVMGAGPYNITLKWEDLREFTRQEIFKQAHAALDSLIEQINAKTMKDAVKEAEKQAPLVKIVENQVPNYRNPVWQAMQAAEKKGEK